MTFADGNVARPLPAPPADGPPSHPAPRRPRKPVSRTRRILGGAASLAVLVAFLGLGAYAFGLPVKHWLGLGDGREYLQTPGSAYGDGNLEKTVLPHFGVQLPCDVQDLHWGDSEDQGPTGTLYLKFQTTDACLATFLNGNALGVDSLDQLPEAPQSFHWRVPDAASYYFGHPNRENDLRVWVDASDVRPTVWAIAKHY